MEKYSRISIKYSAGLEKAHRKKYILPCVIPLQPGILIFHIYPCQFCVFLISLAPCSRYDGSLFW